MTALAESDLVMIDGLSFPLTILYGLKRIHRHPTSATPFHIIIMGATQKTEQRIWEVKWLVNCLAFVTFLFVAALRL